MGGRADGRTGRHRGIRRRQADVTTIMQAGRWADGQTEGHQAMSPDVTIARPPGGRDGLEVGQQRRGVDRPNERDRAATSPNRT